MKKTLIAMAAVAVAGAASAQVTITGNLAFGFAGDTTSAGVSTRGFGTDTSNLTFATSEDLGGGLSLTASASFENFAEDAALAGTGVNMAVSGGFGTVSFSSDESGDFLPVDGLTTNGNGTVADRAAYTSPSMGGATLTISHGDDIGVIDADGSGSVGKSTAAALSYSEGPLSLMYQNLTIGGAGTTNLSSGLSGRNYYKVGYDMGVAAVTYGIIKTDATTDNTETGLTIVAPVGSALTLTAGFSTSKDLGGTSYSGSSVKVVYALSKRTSLSMYTESYESTGTSNVKEYSLLLNTSF